MSKASEVKVPRGFKTNWMGMKKHLQCNELILRGVYQQGDEAEQRLVMAAKLSVWEAGLWKNFQESEDLVVFASVQWRLLAPEVRKNAAKMGVIVTNQEKSHWIHGMLVIKNKEVAEKKMAKEKEVAENLLAASAPPYFIRASFPRQKENIDVAHADIGLASPFESHRPATRTTTNSTSYNSYAGPPSPASTATLGYEEKLPTFAQNHKDNFVREEISRPSSSQTSTRSSSTRSSASEDSSSYHSTKSSTRPRTSNQIKIDRLLTEKAKMEHARVQVLKEFLSPEALKYVMDIESRQQRVDGEIGFYS